MIQESTQVLNYWNEFIIAKISTKKKVQYDFTQVDQQSEQGKQGKSRNMRPTYNTDGLYYTPAFLNGEEKISRLDKQCHSMIHADRVEAEQNQIDVQNIFIPKPSERNSYCTICKIRFQDYREHLENQEHLKKMKFTKYNEQIAKLCKKFPPPKTKPIRKERKSKKIMNTDDFAVIVNSRNSS